MNKQQMAAVLVPGLDAEELKDRIEQMQDLLEVILRDDFISDTGKVIYANGIIRVKEILEQLQDALKNAKNNETAE
ncbi:MAG: hypothetical protein ACOCOC_04165 [Prevotella sp.]|jgi:hypothetical protein